MWSFPTSEKGILVQEEELSVRTFYTLAFLGFIQGKMKR